MKITKSQLKQIIKEELEDLTLEEGFFKDIKNRVTDTLGMTRILKGDHYKLYIKRLEYAMKELKDAKKSYSSGGESYARFVDPDNEISGELYDIHKMLEEKGRDYRGASENLRRVNVKEHTEAMEHLEKTIDAVKKSIRQAIKKAAARQGREDDERQKIQDEKDQIRADEERANFKNALSYVKAKLGTWNLTPEQASGAQATHDADRDARDRSSARRKAANKYRTSGQEWGEATESKMKLTKSQLKQIIKEELEEARLPAWERPGYVPKPGLGPEDPAAEKSQKTNMNRSLGEFAQWVSEVDGHIESISGEHVTADEIPSDINLYDMWLSGMSPDQVAQDLTTRDY